MRNLTVYEDGYVPQNPTLGGGSASVVSGGTLISDAPIGTSQVSTAIPQNPNVISEPLVSDPKPPKGTSAIAEPIFEPTNDTTPTGTTTTTPTGTTTTTPTRTTTTSPILTGGGGGAMGGGAGGGSAEETTDKPKEEKPFPYWIVAVALVGGYLIFRKK
jgi:hypothetical protein